MVYKRPGGLYMATAIVKLKWHTAYRSSDTRCYATCIIVDETRS